MPVPFTIIIFWICSIIWGIYHWYQENSHSIDYSAMRKVAFTLDAYNSKSETSIESLNSSDDDNTRGKARTVRYEETKTRWPSKTSVNKL